MVQQVLGDSRISKILLYTRRLATIVGSLVLIALLAAFFYSVAQDQLARDFCQRGGFDDGKTLPDGRIACGSYLVLPSE